MAEAANHFARQVGTASTTSTLRQQALATASFTPVEGETWYVLYSATVQHESTATQGVADLQRGSDGAVLGELVIEQQDVFELYAFCGVAIETIGASPAPRTYNLGHRNATGSVNNDLQFGAICALRKGGNDADAASDAESSTLLTTLQEKVELTVPAAGDYLLYWSCEAGLDGGIGDFAVQFQHNDAAVLDFDHFSQETRNFYSFSHARKITAAAGDTFQIKWRKVADNEAALIRRARIVALDLSRFAASYVQESLAQSSDTSEVLTQKTLLQAGAAGMQARNHLIFAASRQWSSSNSTQGRVFFDEDTGGGAFAGNLGDSRREPDEAGEEVGAVFIHRPTVAAGYQWRQRYGRASGGGTSLFDNFALTAIDLEAAGGGPVAKAAADAPAVAAGEGAPAILGTLARLDGLGLTLGEAAAAVLVATAEALGLALGGAAALLVRLDRGDEGRAALAEGTPAIAATLAVADALGVSLAEARAIFVFAQTVDSAGLALGEAAAAGILTLKAAADGLGLTLAELAALVAALEGADALSVGTGGAASLLALLAADEALLVALPGATALEARLAVADALGLDAAGVAGIAATLAASDALALDADEAAALTALVALADALGLSAAELALLADLLPEVPGRIAVTERLATLLAAADAPRFAVAASDRAVTTIAVTESAVA